MADGVSPENPDGAELLLEPGRSPGRRSRTGTRWSRTASRAAQFTVDDVHAEHDRLAGLGVRFTQEPADMGPVTTAVFDDTCGNLIQIVTPTG